MPQNSLNPYDFAGLVGNMRSRTDLMPQQGHHPFYKKLDKIIQTKEMYLKWINCN